MQIVNLLFTHRVAEAHCDGEEIEKVLEKQRKEKSYSIKPKSDYIK